ncbi:MAG TPA: lamin tail domain-containing protein [Planctomycetota bacterium]|nr:lamin tail domain-containing protein [Planctomycetota bacterium]
MLTSAGAQRGFWDAAAIALALLAGAGVPRPALAAGITLSEILASNQRTLLDEDGDSSDWIELHNPGPGDSDLEGWHLTDDPGLLRKWRIPAVTLPSGGYLIVFASGKDRALAGSELHASFKLEDGGEYLALVEPDGSTVVEELAPYPPQRGDISFGTGEEAVGEKLIAAGAPARVLIPRDDSLGLRWTGGPEDEPFDDSTAAGWLAASTGVGFDAGGDDLLPLAYWTLDDALDPGIAADSSGNGNDGVVTSHFALAGRGAASTPVYTADGGGHTGMPGDRALDFGPRGDGALLSVPAAARGAFDSATRNNAITLSLWIFGSGDQPADDVLFWGSSSPNGTGTRSINAHAPWSDGVIYWDTAGCCDGTQRISRAENDSTRWRGRWNHYVFVKDGDVKQIWQNGTLFHEGINTADLTLIRGLQIGGALNNGEWSYGGLIDDVAIWDAALGEGQIESLAAGSSPLRLSSISPLLGTDVREAMHTVNASAYIRIPFAFDGRGGFNSLVLRMKYNDGFVAYLNGVEVARRNAPADVRFDSAALEARERKEAFLFEDIRIGASPGLLLVGANLLAIHGLNHSASSPEFLVLPELIAIRTTPGRYLSPPTPGAANVAGVVDFVADTKFSIDRGFLGGPIDVEVSSATEGSEVYYTTDGSEPGPGKPGSTRYDGPIHVATTTTLRAAAFKDDYMPTDIDTHTYIFIASVARQPARPPGLSAVWEGGFPADYGMDPDVVDTTIPGHNIDDALLSIPSVSITMKPEDLFGNGGGIYFRSSQRSERPGSFELIHADGGRGFQINAGVRIHGHTSRDNNFTPKHSFRIVFKGLFGPPKLETPLFPDSPVERFDQVVLKGMSTDSWPVMDGWSSPIPGVPRWFREKSQYLREQWMKDSQLEMGQLSCHGTFVHLYLNGLYWGLYHLTERPTDSFLSEHLGGEREEYDVFHDFAELHSGEPEAWNEMMSLAARGLGPDREYQQIQGNNPDGSRNPDFPKYLDVDNLIDYMILHIYAGADDWPNHNWWAGRRRGPESLGFKFFVWDQEITNISLVQTQTSWGTRFEDVSAGGSPAFLYAKLRANAEFRMRFADRVHRHLFGNGALTPEASDARWRRRAAEIDRAIVGESARWGDVRRAVPYKREVEWLAEGEWMHGTYWTQNFPRALQRFRNVGLYPTPAAPVLGRNGGRIEAGFELLVTAPAGAVLYTLDGTDPRLPGGSVAPGAIEALGSIRLERTASVKARTRDGTRWSPLAEALYFIDTPLRVTEIMYHPAPGPEDSPFDQDDFEFLEIENVGTEPVDLTRCRLTGGVEFDFALGDLLTLGPGKLAVLPRNIDAFASRYPLRGLLIPGVYRGELGNDGERIILLGPSGEAIQDFRYDDAWDPDTDGIGWSLVPHDPRADPAAWSDGGTWRASRSAGGSPGEDESAPASGLQLGGDFNQDGERNISDVVAFLGHLFLGAAASPPCEGPFAEGGNLALLDSNGDERLDLSDAIHLLGYLFLGGGAHALGPGCVPLAGCLETCAQ